MNSRTIPFYQQAPFIRLIIPLCLGIILQWYVELPFTTLWIVSLTIFFCCLLFSFSSLKIRFRYSYIAGAFIHLLIGLLGMMLVSMKDIRNNKLWFGNQEQLNATYLATIISSPKEGTNSYKSIAEVNGFYSNERYHNCKGKIIIYFSKRISITLKPGNKILFNQALSLITNTNNPETFDYRQYCLFKEITHQVYLKENDYKVYADAPNTFNTSIHDLTEKILNVLRRYIPSHKESGLAEAMMIGYKDDLDKELLQSYTDAGVVHIIAISGMHLTLIYGLLIAITFPLNPIKKFIWWRASIVLTGTWVFTFLTGFQASILRAGIMLNCFVLAKLIIRKTSSLNSLAFSAFILLCFNPYWLWDIGFQLSYLAVAGIFIFYKPILNRISFQNKLITAVWKSIALTLSAQILTTPVSIYYFHQFPRLFLLSNLIAVPLSSIILLFEIILISFSWLPFIATYFGKAVYILIYCLDEFVILIQKIPQSIWKGISISIFQCLIIYVVIFCIASYLKHKNMLLKYIAALGILVFCLIRLASFYESSHQHKLIVFNIPGHQAVQLVDKRSSWIITDGINHDNFIQSIHPAQIKWRLGVPTICFDKQFQLVNNKIIIIDSTFSIRPTTVKNHIDYFIFSKNVQPDITYLLQYFSFGQIIFDSSLPPWKERILKAQCDSLKISYYDVRTQGAFVRDL